MITIINKGNCCNSTENHGTEQNCYEPCPHNHDARYYTRPIIDSLLANISTDTVFFGILMPSNTFGKDNDTYFTITGDRAVYKKLEGAWVLQGHLHEDIDLSNYYTKEEVDGIIDNLPPLPDFKTINGESIIGTGDIEIPIIDTTLFVKKNGINTVGDTNPFGLHTSGLEMELTQTDFRLIDRDLNNNQILIDPTQGSLTMLSRNDSKLELDKQHIRWFHTNGGYSRLRQADAGFLSELKFPNSDRPVNIIPISVNGVFADENGEITIPTVGSLQTVTTGTGNNTTSNAIQVIGDSGFNPSINGLALVYSQSGSNTGGALLATLDNKPLGEISFRDLGTNFYSYKNGAIIGGLQIREETSSLAAIQMIGRVSGNDAINPNEFVTKAQLDAKPSGATSLQGVTTGVGNNETSNSILVKGITGFDPTKNGLHLFSNGANSNILQVYDGEEKGNLLFNANGSLSLSYGDTQLGIGRETGQYAGVNIQGRVSGFPAINNDEYVTKSQLDAASGGGDFVTKNTDNIIDGANWKVSAVNPYSTGNFISLQPIAREAEGGGVEVIGYGVKKTNSDDISYMDEGSFNISFPEGNFRINPDSIYKELDDGTGNVDLFDLKFPKNSGTIPLSVNGIFANASGEITIPSGSVTTGSGLRDDAGTIKLGSVDGVSGLVTEDALLIKGNVGALNYSGSMYMPNNIYQMISMNGSSNTQSSVRVGNDIAYILRSYQGLGNQQIAFLSEAEGRKMRVVDDINSKGFEYSADYSANFTEHSLVTKKYVDNSTNDFVSKSKVNIVTNPFSLENNRLATKLGTNDYWTMKGKTVQTNLSVELGVNGITFVDSNSGSTGVDRNRFFSGGFEWAIGGFTYRGNLFIPTSGSSYTKLPVGGAYNDSKILATSVNGIFADDNGNIVVPTGGSAIIEDVSITEYKTGIEMTALYPTVNIGDEIYCRNIETMYKKITATRWAVTLYTSELGEIQ